MSRLPPHDLAYERLEEDAPPYDPHAEDAARGPLILALAFGVLLVFAAVVWNTYRQGIKDGASEVPIIAAPDTPYKRPVASAGHEEDDLDKRIYDQLDGSNRVETVEPKKVASVTVMSPKDVADPESRAAEPLEALPETEPEPDYAALEAEEEKETLAGGLDLRPKRAPPPAEKETAEVAPASPSPPVAASPLEGAYLIQLAALRSEEAANKAWVSISSRRPALLEGLEKTIQRADLGQKGVYFRLRVGPFEDRESAADLCAAMEKSGQPCMVVRR